MRTCGFIVVDVDSLQLEVRVTMVGTGGVNTVLVRDHLPKLERKRKEQINTSQNQANNKSIDGWVFGA